GLVDAVDATEKAMPVEQFGEILERGGLAATLNLGGFGELHAVHAGREFGWTLGENLRDLDTFGGKISLGLERPEQTQRDEYRAAPGAHDIDDEGGPVREQHEFRRGGGNLVVAADAERGQIIAGKAINAFGSPGGEDRGAGLLH